MAWCGVLRSAAEFWPRGLGVFFWGQEFGVRGGTMPKGANDMCNFEAFGLGLNKLLENRRLAAKVDWSWGKYMKLRRSQALMTCRRGIMRGGLGCEEENVRGRVGI